MTSFEQSDSAGEWVPTVVLKQIDRALQANITAAITVMPELQREYQDDPRWSPWTRFLEPAAKRASEARTALREARKPR